MKIFLLFLLIAGTILLGKGILVIWSEGLYSKSNSIVHYPWLGAGIMIVSLLALFILKKGEEEYRRKHEQCAFHKYKRSEL